MIYFVRHGLSEANKKKVFAGQNDDSPLVDEGRIQAKETGQRIKNEGIKIDRIITSPLSRAVETAYIIAKEIDFDISKIIKDERIIEYDLGTLSGTPWNSVINLLEAEGVEDPYTFKDRILSLINDVHHLPGNTLLSGHGIVGRMLKVIEEGRDPKTFNEVRGIENGSITKIDWIK